MSRIGIGLLFILLASLAGCSLPGRIVASGRPVSVPKDFRDFTRVAAGSAFAVDIARGDEFRVEITIDEAMLPYLRVSQEGDTLKIGLESFRSYSWGMGTPQAKIVMPELAGVNFSGAIRGTVTGFKSADDLDVELSGASGLQGDLESGNARLNVSGASKATLKGAAKTLDVTASGASRADLRAFAVTDASVNASGASNVTVNPSGKMDATVSGASKVYYTGNPSLGTVNISGASTLQKR